MWPTTEKIIVDSETNRGSAIPYATGILGHNKNWVLFRSYFYYLYLLIYED